MSAADVLAGRRQWWIDCCDVSEGLARIPDGSVHCVVTSPPYWGLRDYGTGRWEGGDPECTHRVRPAGSGLATIGIDGGRHTQGHQQEGYRDRCRRCGAVRVDRQIGLEATPADWVARLVEVFREVRRVLHPRGVFWLNVGDAYASAPRGNRPGDYSTSRLTNPRRQDELPRAERRLVPGYKAKDLLGLPWRLAFALQEDGWYLRSDVVWHKPNPMPESVTDRPTRAHEYLFLLSRSPRYHYDAAAIAEPVVAGCKGSTFDGPRDLTVRPDTGQGRRSGDTGFRNRRSVWTVATEPFSAAHFATFPTALVEPCILAGCPRGGVVLDPFAGSGPTLMVALRHGRRALGIELNPKYVGMAADRIFLDAPMFNGVAGAAE